MDIPAVLSHPLTLVVAGILGFFLKDLFFQVKQGATNKVEIEGLIKRVSALELAHSEYRELKITITRLEVQVSNLTENIQYLLKEIRGQHSG